MSTIHAIYEHGVFRLIQPIDLPERCEVEVEINAVKPELKQPSLDDVYALLGRRHSSGEIDVAAKHDEYQP